MLGAALAAFAGITGGPDKGVLFGEWIAIWAFGISWLVKGAERETLFGRRAEGTPVEAGAQGSRRSSAPSAPRT